MAFSVLSSMASTKVMSTGGLIGTLTQDRVILEKHRDIRGEVDLRVLENAYLNSYYQTGLKNLLDRAVLEHAELRHKLDVLQLADKVDEIPFDFLRRRMSVVVTNAARERVLICKGAVEEVFTIWNAFPARASLVIVTGPFPVLVA